MFTSYVAPSMDRLREDVRSLTPTDRRRAWLPTRPRMDALSRDELACTSAAVVQELTSIFREACERCQWSLARQTGQHVLVIYAVVYGWRYPLVGTSIPPALFHIPVHAADARARARRTPPRLTRPSTDPRMHGSVIDDGAGGCDAVRPVREGVFGNGDEHGWLAQ